MEGTSEYGSVILWIRLDEGSVTDVEYTVNHRSLLFDTSTNSYAWRRVPCSNSRIVVEVLHVVAGRNGARTIAARAGAKTIPIPDELQLTPVVSILKGSDRAFGISKRYHVCTRGVGCLWQRSGTVQLQLRFESVRRREWRWRSIFTIGDCRPANVCKFPTGEGSANPNKETISERVKV